MALLADALSVLQLSRVLNEVIGAGQLENQITYKDVRNSGEAGYGERLPA